MSMYANKTPTELLFAYRKTRNAIQRAGIKKALKQYRANLARLITKARKEMDSYHGASWEAVGCRLQSMERMASFVDSALQ